MPQTKAQKNDLTAWVKSGGHELLGDMEENGVYKFWIRKA